MAQVRQRGSSKFLRHLARIALVLLFADLAAAQGEDAGSPAAHVEAFGDASPPDDTGWADVYDLAGDSLLRLPYVSVDGMAIFEGDIVLGPESLFETAPGEEGVLRGVALIGVGQRWRDGIFYYEANPGHRYWSAILDAMEEIAAATSIRFLQRSQESAYVAFDESAGCSSYVGKQGNRQGISLARGCQHAASHEIFHALGVFHEQSRSDRDDHVTVHFENVSPGFEGNFTIAVGQQDIGPYDYESIMHYSAYAFTSNGQPTITTIPPGIPIGNRSTLSAGDIATIQFMYYTDLRLDLDTDATTVGRGARFDLELTVSNHGDTAIGDIVARDVVVSLPLAEASSFSGFTSDEPWSCRWASAMLTCELDTLGRNTSSELILELVAPTDRASIELSPSVSASNRDIVPSNNSDSTKVDIQIPTDLVLDLEAASSRVEIDEMLDVDIDVFNSSPRDAENVRLAVTSPPELEFEAYSGTNWTCTHTLSTTNCTISRLAARTRSVVTLRFAARGQLTGGSIEGNVSTTTPDSDSSNDRDTLQIDVEAETSSRDGNGGGSGGGGGGWKLWGIGSTGLWELLALGILAATPFARQPGRRISSPPVKRVVRTGQPVARRATFMALLLGPIACALATTESHGDVETLYVAPRLVDCHGVVPMKCMRVRPTPKSEWTLFHGEIAGFEHEPGVAYRIEVERTEITAPPADRSSFRYRLLRVVEETAEP